MQPIDDRSVRIGFWAILLLGLFAWAPTIYPGYWRSLEGFTPIFNAIHPSPIASIGVTPDLWRGTGSAAFLLIQPMRLLGVEPVAAVRVVFALSFLLGGMGIYVWLRPRLGDRAAGLAGLVYMFLPVFLATVYVRGSIADAQILGLLPLAMAGVAVYSEHRTPSAAGVVVISILWMWRTQAGLAIFATLLIFFYVLTVERNRMALLIVVVSALASLVSLIPLRDIQAPSPEVFADHFVYLYQLFANGWATAPSIAGWQDGYPFQLGFVALIFSALTFWVWRTTGRRNISDPNNRLLTFGFVAATIIVLLSTTVSEPLWRLTRADRLLTYPWQIMLISGVCLAVTAGSLPALQESLSRIPYWVVLVTLCIAASYPYLAPAFIQVTPPERPVAIFGPDNDLVLLEADLTENRADEQTQLDVSWQVLRPIDFDYNIFLQALATQPNDDTPRVVGQLDIQPLSGEYPATLWQQGEVLTDTYTLDLDWAGAQIDPDTAQLRYYFGYYDWRDGQRWPVDGGIDDKWVIYGE